MTLLLSSILFHRHSVHLHCLLFKTSLLKSTGNAVKVYFLTQGWLIQENYQIHDEKHFMLVVEKVFKTDSQKGKTYTILPKIYLLLLEKLSAVS